MKRLAFRILQEPALVTAVILAAGNLLVDYVAAEQVATVANTVETLLTLIAGFVVRQNVTPVRSIPNN